MLETNVFEPAGAGDGTPVIVLLHGRGTDADDLVPLRPGLPADAALVLPRAPHPGAPWGYGPGWAWYRYEGGDRPEPESFRASQAALDALMAGLPGLLGREPGPVALGGFSQGGTMSLGWALRNPGAATAVVVFSGFLPDHPDVVPSAETLRRTRFWWGHGTLDPAVPHELAIGGRRALAVAGASLEVRDYPIGHGIVPEELADATAWLKPRLEPVRGR
ncbi:MAG: alpha/beta hydrolase [Gemmatimonadota bacterium]